MEVTIESIDLIYKLWGLVAFVFVQFITFVISFVILQQKVKVLEKEQEKMEANHKDSNELLWKKFDDLKQAVDKSNLTLGKIENLLELKNQHDSRGDHRP